MSSYRGSTINSDRRVNSRIQQGSQGFGSSYHPVRSTRYVPTYDFRSSVTPVVSTNASTHQTGHAVNVTASGRKPVSGKFETTSSLPSKTSKLRVHKDPDMTLSPYRSVVHGAISKDRVESPTSDATAEEEDEDPRTDIKKGLDLMKEIQKIDLEKCDLLYRRLMENLDPSTLTKELAYSQRKGNVENKTFAKAEKNLRKERDDLQKEIIELRSKLEEDEFKRNQMQIRYTAEAKKEIDDLHMKLQEEEEKAMARKTQFEEQIFDFQEKEKKWKEEVEKLQDELRAMKVNVRNAERGQKTAEREKTEALTRLSKEMGTKLNNKNPNIADLSDANRPTKLAEKYNELYDNEWTDALEILESMGEEPSIKVLLQIMETSYQFCKETASEQMQKLKNLLLVPVHTREAWRESTTGSDTPATVSRLLKECQKEVKMENPGVLYKEYISGRKSTALAVKVADYVKKCLEICWLMVIQDPPVVLGKAAEAGDAFDQNTFKEYTRTGNVVSFTVWLPLILHENGPLLCKGTAQPVPSKPIERGRTGMSSGRSTKKYHGGGDDHAASALKSGHTSSTQPKDNYAPPLETDVDAMFASNPKIRAARQQEKKYEERAHSAPSKDRVREREFRQPVPTSSQQTLGIEAEYLRSGYGVGPRLIHTSTGKMYIYYDGRAYTQAEWDEMSSSHLNADQGSSYA